MTEDPLIESAVARLARGRRAPPLSRAELRDHLLQAASERAGAGRITVEHVEQAIAGLGGAQAVRDTFFPAMPRPKMHVAAPWVLAGIVVLVLAMMITTPPRAMCSTVPGGDCSVSSNGFTVDLAFLLLPPITVLVSMWLAPAWLGAVIAAVYAAWTLVEAVNDDGVQALRAAVVLFAGFATLAVAAHHFWRARLAA